jgi:hypothetical protein
LSRKVSLEQAMRWVPDLRDLDREAVEGILSNIRRHMRVVAAVVESRPTSPSPDHDFEAEIEALVEQDGFSADVARRCAEHHYNIRQLK